MACVYIVGGNDIAQNTVHRCTIFSAKDSFLIPATGNEISKGEGVFDIRIISSSKQLQRHT